MVALRDKYRQMLCYREVEDLTISAAQKEGLKYGLSGANLDTKGNPDARARETTRENFWPEAVVNVNSVFRPYCLALPVLGHLQAQVSSYVVSSLRHNSYIVRLRYRRRPRQFLQYLQSSTQTSRSGLSVEESVCPVRT